MKLKICSSSRRCRLWIRSGSGLHPACCRLSGPEEPPKSPAGLSGDLFCPGASALRHRPGPKPLLWQVCLSPDHLRLVALLPGGSLSVSKQRLWLPRHWHVLLLRLCTRGPWALQQSGVLHPVPDSGPDLLGQQPGPQLPAGGPKQYLVPEHWQYRRAGDPERPWQREEGRDAVWSFWKSQDVSRDLPWVAELGSSGDQCPLLVRRHRIF